MNAEVYAAKYRNFRNHCIPIKFQYQRSKSRIYYWRVLPALQCGKPLQTCCIVMEDDHLGSRSDIE
jgi:hypothetical protein